MHRKIQTAALGAIMSIGLAAPAMAADGVHAQPQIALAAAVAAAQAAVDKCTADGYRVTATVVDAGGNVVAALRANGAGPHTVDASRRKAFTAASTKRSTSQLVDVVGKFKKSAALGDIGGFLLLGGGMPIKSGKDVVGAIGVGGAPGGHLDDICATAGIEAIKGKL